MNPRSAQMLTAGLAVLLVVLLGATIFVLLNRQSPAPSPVPSDVLSVAPTFSARVSELPSAAPTVVPTPSPTPSLAITLAPSMAPSDMASPSLSPTLTPSPTPTPSPSPTPTPQPTINPTAPLRELRLVDLGIDHRGDASEPRYVTVDVDGQSLLRATLSDVSAGTVRMCIIRQDKAAPQVCNTRNRAVEQAVTDSGPSVWTIWMIGRDTSVSPTATVTISFNSLAPTATLGSFRYGGTSAGTYNGFTAEVRALNGCDPDTSETSCLHVQASFEDESFNHRLTISPGDYDVSGGPDPSVEADVPTIPDTLYRISLYDPDEFVDSEAPPFVNASISWR